MTVQIYLQQLTVSVNIQAISYIMTTTELMSMLKFGGLDRAVDFTLSFIAFDNKVCDKAMQIRQCRLCHRRRGDFTDCQSSEHWWLIKYYRGHFLKSVTLTAPVPTSIILSSSSTSESSGLDLACTNNAVQDKG